EVVISGDRDEHGDLPAIDTGDRDEHGDLPAIDGGFVPFFVDALGAHVTMQGLHFVRPQGAAIWIFAVSGLVIADCRIEAVEPSAEFGSYIFTRDRFAIPIFVSPPGPHSLAQTPENLSGTMWISNNDIDVAGTADDSSVGIAVFGAGRSPDKEVDLSIL